MKKRGQPAVDRVTDAGRRPHRVRLPGFIVDEEVGLGDAIKRATYAIGIKPCGGSWSNLKPGKARKLCLGQQHLGLPTPRLPRRLRHEDRYRRAAGRASFRLKREPGPVRIVVAGRTGQVLRR